MNYYPINNELYHYGVLGMKWGVRRYQPYPSGSKKGKEIGEAAKAKRAAGLQKQYTKAVKKFNKIDAKRESSQQYANKQFAKAEKKTYARFFKSEKKVEKAFDRARSAQYDANKLAIKGEKWWRAMESAFANSGLNFDPEVRAMGQRYIDMVAGNSRMMSTQAFVRERALAHSAKGSTWEDHKYIKRVDGTYYYPDSYEGGRHISDLEGNSDEKEESSEKREKLDLTENDIETLAWETIRGDYGNGQLRKELLGENYAEIQARVNQLYREGKVTGSNTVLSSASESTVAEGKNAADDAAKKASTVQSKAGLNLDQIYSVYAKRENKNAAGSGEDRARVETRDDERSSLKRS